MELPIARALKTFEPALGSSDRTFYISRIPNLDRCLGTFELVSIGAKHIRRASVPTIDAPNRLAMSHHKHVHVVLRGQTWGEFVVH